MTIKVYTKYRSEEATLIANWQEYIGSPRSAGTLYSLGIDMEREVLKIFGYRADQPREDHSATLLIEISFGDLKWLADGVEWEKLHGAEEDRIIEEWRQSRQGTSE